MSNTNNILFQDEKAKGNVTNLIPVFINTCRCASYYWIWRANIGDWVRDAPIPENLKKLYNTPQPKSNY